MNRRKDEQEFNKIDSSIPVMGIDANYIIYSGCKKYFQVVKFTEKCVILKQVKRVETKINNSDFSFEDVVGAKIIRRKLTAKSMSRIHISKSETVFIFARG